MFNHRVLYGNVQNHHPCYIYYDVDDSSLWEPLHAYFGIGTAHVRPEGGGEGGGGGGEGRARGGGRGGAMVGESRGGKGKAMRRDTEDPEEISLEVSVHVRMKFEYICVCTYIPLVLHIHNTAFRPCPVCIRSHRP